MSWYGNFGRQGKRLPMKKVIIPKDSIVSEFNEAYGVDKMKTEKQVRPLRPIHSMEYGTKIVYYEDHLAIVADLKQAIFAELSQVARELSYSMNKSFGPEWKKLKIPIVDAIILIEKGFAKDEKNK